MKFKVVLSALIVSAIAVFGIPAPAAASSQPSAVSYVVVPHPDDEWQTWSLVENSPANYKVFITVTRGDQSGYCTAPHPGGVLPTPAPAGKWTPECDDARLSSWLGFFTKMSQNDPTIPGDWAALGDVGPFPANGYSLTVDDGGNVYESDRMARVWVDQQGRGAAISFDLGDGDLTASEVQWAIETVRDNRTALGLNDTLPNWNIIGGFRNSGYSNCAVYNHDDHTAVHRALYNVNFGMDGYQTAATCASDPDVVRTKLVTDKSAWSAWSGAESAFKSSYGWLGQYWLSWNQSSLFMQKQSFWQRY